MRRYVVSLLLIAACTFKAQSQGSETGPAIKLSGFIKNDIFYDTRQSSPANGLREGHFFLYPDNVIYDAGMNDLNANPSFHILNIQTRLRADLSGPDAFGAKTSGAIEAEFFGTSESDLNGFRLRHAYVKLDWKTTTLLIGQYWHPLFPTESYPGTLSFNTGAPFVPFSRNPQIRITKTTEVMSFSLTAYSQRDFTSSGPDGGSSKYLRNSGLPGMNFQLRIAGGNVFTGWAGIDYKRLRPEIVTSANAETDAMIGSFTFFGNIKIKSEPVNISVMGVYGKNSSDLVMIGGYAVAEITDPVHQYKKYTNLNTASVWADFTTNGEKVKAGLFTGFSKNLGADDQISGAVYGRGTNIDRLFRVSPRIVVTEGRLSFGAEVESTTAAYGTAGSDGRVSDTHNVTNVRVLLSTIYKF